MQMLDIALGCLKRGWHVFPCKLDKSPFAALAPHGVLNASNDEDLIREWWQRAPNASVGIACGPSGLIVVDTDEGLPSSSDIPGFLEAIGAGPGAAVTTYAVRTGRRPEFGLQMYYLADKSRKTVRYKTGGYKGEVRCDGAYVVAAGCNHPSGAVYEVFNDRPLEPVPQWVLNIAPERLKFDSEDAASDEQRQEWKTWLFEYAAHHELDLNGFEKDEPNGVRLGITCPWVKEHSKGAGTVSSTVLCILDGKVVFICSHGSCGRANRVSRYFKAEMDSQHGVFQQEPGELPKPIIGTGLPMPKVKEAALALVTLDYEDARKLFHSKDDILNCPKPSFFIENWLARQAICAIAAPVGQRKSLIAMNMMHAMATGKPLFGFLPVHNRPTRVLYLCPEMGLISLSNRLIKMGLEDYLDDYLFVRSMNMGELGLLEIPQILLPGSVVIADTAIRFMSGNENDSSEMKDFSKVMFELQQRQGNDGSIVTLYHSPKEAKTVSEVTLENSMRGSGELGASLTDGHGTRMQPFDAPKTEYDAESYIKHIKPRDYEGIPPFMVLSDRATGLLTKSGEGVAVCKVPKRGNKGNTDGNDAQAKQLILENIELSEESLKALLEGHSIVRSTTAIGRLRRAAKKELSTGGHKVAKS